MELYNLWPGSWGSNCYLLVNDGHALVVDPSADAKTILSAACENGVVLDGILLTHGHFDHIISIDALRKSIPSLPVYIHSDDMDFPQDAQKNAFSVFFPMERTWMRPEKALQDGEVLMLAGQSIRVIHTPGHTQGSVCLLCNDTFLLTGDTLFSNGIGRCDLYSGSYERIQQSLQLLRELPQDLPIYPGHGDSCSLGEALMRQHI
jgi:glyoxylase-like metal-dependent hydrolase (beta-lactamase superfamily II)